MLVLGTFEGGYNHITKLVLFYPRVSPALLQSFFPAYEYVLPNDFIFEATGVLTLVAAYFTALHTYRLVVKDAGRGALRQALAVAIGFALLTLLVDGPQLILYMNRFELSYLVPVALLLALGALAFAAIRIYRKVEAS